MDRARSKQIKVSAPGIVAKSRETAVWASSAPFFVLCIVGIDDKINKRSWKDGSWLRYLSRNTLACPSCIRRRHILRSRVELGNRVFGPGEKWTSLVSRLAHEELKLREAKGSEVEGPITRSDRTDSVRREVPQTCRISGAESFGNQASRGKL